MSPSLQATVVTETFTDYAAFLKLLGPSAQVVTFDDVPTTNGLGFFDPHRYADQGLVFSFGGPTALSVPDAVSPPNVYASTVLGGAFRSQSALTFTSGGTSALTSAFGTFFIGNQPVDGSDLSGLAIGGDFNFIDAPTTASSTGSTFLGLATVDSVTGQLVPAINEIYVNAGAQDLLTVYLDNFTFATPVSPVPEANGWVLLAATALAAVGRAWRRARGKLIFGFALR